MDKIINRLIGKIIVNCSPTILFNYQLSHM